jgi:hypothetical protein
MSGRSAMAGPGPVATISRSGDIRNDQLGTSTATRRSPSTANRATAGMVSRRGSSGA